ncbi:DNA topoisomerase IA [Erwinia rhapontici]|nr:DNA topoisomerase IA [Erwinia rhapontici]
MSHLKIDNIPDAIRTIKHQLRQQLPHYRAVFAELDDEMHLQIHALKAEQQRGEHPVPELDANDILNHRVTEQQKKTHPPARLLHGAWRLPPRAGHGVEHAYWPLS